jgi:hypothetical protein
MSPWTPEDVSALTTPEEVQVITRRRDGSLRRPTTIWVVADRDRVFIRSTNGRSASRFRGALATGAGQLVARGTAYVVAFTEAAERDLDRVDAAYRGKYGRYASIVDHLEAPGPRAATLEVPPAQHARRDGRGPCHHADVAPVTHPAEATKSHPERRRA